MFKLVALVGLLVLVSSVDAQRRRTTEATTTISEEPATVETSNVNESAETTDSTTEGNISLVETIRKEIEKRREEGQKRIEQLWDRVLQNLEDLSDRKREYTLRRQERQRNAEEMRAERRREMEARRVGRVPAREQNRVNQLRLQQLQQQNLDQDDAQNEVDGGGAEFPPAAAAAIGDVRRSIVLIEEANGNVRLVDLGTEEGRALISRVAEQVEGETDSQEDLKKLKLKSGQL